MQISSNTTGMSTDITVTTDKDGRDYCVVVVKGTFVLEKDGQPTLAEEQEPMVYADVHFGDPAETSIQYECDFAPFKPHADILVNGFAYSPTREPVNQLPVQLEAGPIKKQIMVFGDRKWDVTPVGTRVTPTIPFVKMPLIYERAFGGSDIADPNPSYHGKEMRNPIGVGYHKSGATAFVHNTPLPNLEDPQHLINGWSDKPPPAGFGAIGRGWLPNLKYAGTYDQKWLDNICPLLPPDFDERYYQSAPLDQQLPYLKGGEFVRCINMSPDQVFTFNVPKMEFPVTYCFHDQDITVQPNLDTLLIEPDMRRFFLVWRARIAVGRKLKGLREIRVGAYHPLSQYGEIAL